MQTNWNFSTNDFYRLIRDNLDLIRTIVDSLWSHASTVLAICSTVLSFVFTGGFALWNFFLSLMVFITLLFYLLSQSDQPVYRPTHWLNNVLAIGNYGLGEAVSDAVTSVFLASLKMATFYGLYTYLVHTLIGSHLSVVPALIAALCAVTLKSYWAVLPGCLDLWLLQHRPISACVLLLVQIVPVYVVDATIYSEVKGGGHQVNACLSH